MPTDREQQEVERLRWVFWECDCGALNREARPGFQHPCPACGHPATIDPVEVMPVSEHEAALQAEREKTEAAKLEASDLRVELQLAEWDRQCLRQKLSEQPDMANISGRSEAGDKSPITAHTEQPDTEGGDADAHCPRGHEAIPVAEGAAVDDGRALSEHWREQAREAAMHSPEYGEQAAWEAARLAPQGTGWVLESAGLPLVAGADGGAQMRDEMTNWIRERPESVQRLMIDWPPMATVRARRGEVLMVPGPGVEGEIASWFEDGTVGVEAALTQPVTNPAGETLEAGTVLRGQCDPAKLEIVRYAEMPDGTLLDSDYIRSVVEAID